MVGRAQQPRGDKVLPAMPRLGSTWVHDIYQLIDVGGRISVLVEREARPWDKHDDGLFDRLCV